MFLLLHLAVTYGISWFAYNKTKTFVETRLRFVEAAQTSTAPWIAGAAAFSLGAVVALLPFVSIPMAAVLGISTGLGVRSGQRQRRLPPGM